jgi:hypothetical protein
MITTSPLSRAVDCHGRGSRASARDPQPGQNAGRHGRLRLPGRREQPALPLPQAEMVAEVYGDHPAATPGRSAVVSDVVPVDLELPGCPISKAEFEWLVRHLILGIEPRFPQYPVCVECKQRMNACVLDHGHLCMGPVTRGGCNAVCPRNRFGCWGCRGPAEEANFDRWCKSCTTMAFGAGDCRAANFSSTHSAA